MGNVASHVYHEIAGCWDLDRLTAALRSVVLQHGMLRTRFTDDGRQLEMPLAEDFGIARHDLTRAVRSRPAGAAACLSAQQRSHRIFPADRAPMLAAEVSVLDAGRMILQVGHDGLVMDGISMFLFFQQWWNAYTDPANSSEQPTEQAAFADYVAALARARDRAPYQRSRGYWLDRLDDLAPLSGSGAAGQPVLDRAAEVQPAPGAVGRGQLGRPEVAGERQRTDPDQACWSRPTPRC